MLKSLFLFLQFKSIFSDNFLSRVRIKLLFTLSYLLRILRSPQVILPSFEHPGPGSGY